jgi:hypothetical protein
MDTLSVILLLAFIYLSVYIAAQWVGVDRLKARGIEAGTPFLILVKTQRLNTLLTRLGKRIPRVFFNIGVIVAFIGMGFGFLMFGDNLLKFFTTPNAEGAGGVVPIIPGVTITGLPLVYMMIGLALALVTHEFAHGLASSKDNIPIKSSGLSSSWFSLGVSLNRMMRSLRSRLAPETVCVFLQRALIRT